LGAGPVTNNGTLIINRSGAYALTNPIGGSGSLVDAGPARLTLTGANTYQGSTYISNGLVVLTARSRFPDAVTVPNSSGGLILDGGSSAGALDLNGFNESVNSLAGAAGTVVGLVTNSAASGTNLLICGVTTWSAAAPSITASSKKTAAAPKSASLSKARARCS